MKPGDHPDFFKFPAPPGRSRESSILLDESGQFWHDGEKVLHRPMARAFASWIRRHPDNGRYILSNGFDWTYFTVQDAPFFVEALRCVSDDAGSHLLLSLSDASEEPLDPGTIVVGPSDAVYVTVKGGLEARFTPHAQLALAPYLAYGPSGECELVLGDRRYPIGVRSPPEGKSRS